MAHSSAEVEYRVITSTASELIWIKQLLKDLKINHQAPMKIFCDNQATRHIASNLVYHKRMKYIEIDCHFIREKIQIKEIETPYVKSKDQLADVFTKGLNARKFQENIFKLGMINFFSPLTSGGVLS
jgi:hypothetical protein